MVVLVVTDKGYVEHKDLRLNDVSLEDVKKTERQPENVLSESVMKNWDLLQPILHILEQ